MTNFAFQHNVGARLVSAIGLRPQSMTTASGATNGADIDRSAQAEQLFSAKVVVSASATLKAAKQASFAVKVQHGDTTTAYTDYKDYQSNTYSTTLTVGTTGSTATQTGVSGIAEFNLDLVSAKKHIRCVVTPTIAVGSSTVTASAIPSVVFVFGGASVTPPA